MIPVTAISMRHDSYEYRIYFKKKENHKFRHAQKLDPGILDPKGTKQIEEHYR